MSKTKVHSELKQPSFLLNEEAIKWAMIDPINIILNRDQQCDYNYESFWT